MSGVPRGSLEPVAGSGKPPPKVPKSEEAAPPGTPDTPTGPCTLGAPARLAAVGAAAADAVAAAGAGTAAGSGAATTGGGDGMTTGAGAGRACGGSGKVCVSRGSADFGALCSASGGGTGGGESIGGGGNDSEGDEAASTAGSTIAGAF